MASPVDDLCEHDPGDERCADDDQRWRTAAGALALRARADLRPGTCRRGRRLGLLVRRRLAASAGSDQARLQLAQENRIRAELLRQPFADAVAAGGQSIGQLLQAVRAALDEQVAFRHFLTGGVSPVATRQILEAARLAAIVAPAERPA